MKVGRNEMTTLVNAYDDYDVITGNLHFLPEIASLPRWMNGMTL